MVGLKTTAQAVFNELQRRGVRVEVVDTDGGIIRYQHGSAWHLQRSSTPDTSSAIGGYICDRKPIANQLAHSLGVPVPAHCTIADDSNEAKALLAKHQRVVVKPSDGAHGNGVTVNVTSEDQLQQAVERARQFTNSGQVVVQQHVTGSDIRVLVIGGKAVAVTKRVPAQVTGDGQHTLRDLITHENDHNPDRGVNYEKKLNKIDVAAAELFLGGRIDTEVPADGATVQVVGTANIGTGGEAHDLTAQILARKDVPGYAETLSAALRMPVCGVDFLWDETSDALHFIEINACPNFGMHLMPAQGEPQPVDVLLVDFLLKA